MIWLDNNEKMNWLFDVLDNNEFAVVSRTLTDEDRAEIRREIAEYRAARAAARVAVKQSAPQVAYA